MEFFNKLPEDLIRENIFPYSYSPQPKDLLTDITSFYKTREILCEFYDAVYSELPEMDPMEWLDNDITRFFNNDIATMYGYTEQHYEIWKRLYFFSDKSHLIIQHITRKMDRKGKVNSNIKIKIALLNRDERTNLLRFLRNIWQQTYNLL